MVTCDLVRLKPLHGFGLDLVATAADYVYLEPGMKGASGGFEARDI